MADLPVTRWEGSGQYDGFHLDGLPFQLAKAEYEKAEARRWDLDDQMIKSTTYLPRGVGLIAPVHSLKTPDGYFAAVTEALHATVPPRPLQLDRPLDQAIHQNDLHRFTLVCPSDGYVDLMPVALGQFQKDGWEPYEAKDFLNCESYWGFHVVLVHDGALVEFQLHTDESFATKQVTHGAYEGMRMLASRGELAKPLIRAFNDWERQCYSDLVPIPERIGVFSDAIQTQFPAITIDAKEPRAPDLGPTTKAAQERVQKEVSQSAPNAAELLPEWLQYVGMRPADRPLPLWLVNRLADAKQLEPTAHSVTLATAAAHLRGGTTARFPSKHVPEGAGHLGIAMLTHDGIAR